jgi:hypothetical protein
MAVLWMIDRGLRGIEDGGERWLVGGLHATFVFGNSKRMLPLASPMIVFAKRTPEGKGVPGGSAGAAMAGSLGVCWTTSRGRYVVRL